VSHASISLPRDMKKPEANNHNGRKLLQTAGKLKAGNPLKARENGNDKSAAATK